MGDTPAKGSSIKTGSSALEEILCREAPAGDLENLIPYVADSWSAEFPGLAVLPSFSGDLNRLRICIATEDVVGPIRNGGIGTTYSALAELLAKLGFDVTLLYLKGRQVETGTIEQWIDFYAAKSVRFVPVPDCAAADRFQAGADRWLHTSYNMLNYLIDHPMDVVHVSEWRGAAYMSLLAKQQRLAFQNTLFIVKTSGPWMWTRLYASQSLENLEDLAKVHAERQSVELADMVIGGSLHLLRWMLSQGYKVPRDRTFVQPNIIAFDHLPESTSRRNWEPGRRYPIDEIVFFGRLEGRKGLFIFIQAINRLLRLGGRLPSHITFMGKLGAPLAARPDQNIFDYINSETRNWPTKVQVLSEYAHDDALQYLLSGSRLAVMPSTIENSSLAVYEAAICGIPFIASTSGGTPELVAAPDHQNVLCESHPIPLAQKIADVLEFGGYVARLSFDNEANLEQWKRFHSDLGRGLLEYLSPAVSEEPKPATSASICIYYTGLAEHLRITLESIKQQDHLPAQILIAVDTDDLTGLRETQSTVESTEVLAEVVSAYDADAGRAFNTLAVRARSDFILFLWAGSTLRPQALGALAKVAATSGAQVLSYLFQIAHEGEKSANDYLNATILGSISQSFFRNNGSSLPIYIRRHTFWELGGFTTDYRVLAGDYELVAKAQANGVRCETVLLELGIVPAWDEAWVRRKGYDGLAAQFRVIRPELAAAPLALRDLLLMAKGLQKQLETRHRAFTSVGLQRDIESGTVRQFRSALAPFSKKRNGVTSHRNNTATRWSSKWGERSAALMAALLSERVNPGGVVRASHLVRAEMTDPILPNTRTPTEHPRVHRYSFGGTKYFGRLLGVHRGLIYGWIRNEQNQEEIVEVEVISAGRVFATFSANMDLPAILPFSPNVHGHGFVLPVWKNAIERFVRRREKRILVRVRGTNVVIADLVVRQDDRDLEGAGFDGYCDVVDTHIRGWVRQISDDRASVDVAAFVDGAFLVRTTASEPRDDVRAAGFGTGAYGFVVALPKQLRDGVAHAIDVVVADTGTLLKRGKLVLVGDTIKVRS